MCLSGSIKGLGFLPFKFLPAKLNPPPSYIESTSYSALARKFESTPAFSAVALAHAIRPPPWGEQLPKEVPTDKCGETYFTCSLSLRL